MTRSLWGGLPPKRKIFLSSPVIWKQLRRRLRAVETHSFGDQGLLLLLSTWESQVLLYPYNTLWWISRAKGYSLLQLDVSLPSLQRISDATQTASSTCHPLNQHQDQMQCQGLFTFPSKSWAVSPRWLVPDQLGIALCKLLRRPTGPSELWYMKYIRYITKRKKMHA